MLNIFYDLLQSDVLFPNTKPLQLFNSRIMQCPSIQNYLYDLDNHLCLNLWLQADKTIKNVRNLLSRTVYSIIFKQEQENQNDQVQINEYQDDQEQNNAFQENKNDQVQINEYQDDQVQINAFQENAKFRKFLLSINYNESISDGAKNFDALNMSFFFQ
jgi:hypothetical protein